MGNTPSMKKAIKAVFDDLMAMPKKELIKIVGKRKPFSSSRLLRKRALLKEVLSVLKDDRTIDDEHVHYFPEKYPFTVDEFDELFRLMDDPTNYDEGQSAFEEYRQYFEYKGFKFIWRLLIGQGSACQLIPLCDQSDTWPSKEFPMKFKEEKKRILK